MLSGRKIDPKLIIDAAAAACNSIEFSSDIHAPADYRRRCWARLSSARCCTLPECRRTSNRNDEDRRTFQSQ